MACTAVPMRRVEHRARRKSRQDFSCAKARSPGARSRAVVTVELLVVLGLFVVVVIGGAESGAGTLVGPVRADEDLSGQARLDDPWARATVRSWVRSGVAREKHSGVPSGAR